MLDKGIYFTRNGAVGFFKFVGDLRHSDSDGVDLLIEQIFAGQGSGAVEDIVVDLSQATYMDSTNLGLLAMIARRLINNAGKKPALIKPDSDLVKLIDSMCLDKVFQPVTTQTADEQQFNVIDATGIDDKQRAEMILAAHQALMELDEKNRTTFQPVVELIQQELKGQ